MTFSDYGKVSLNGEGGAVKLIVLFIVFFIIVGWLFL